MKKFYILIIYKIMKKTNYYFEALKKFNAESENKFCIPKKYSKEYEEIMKIKKEMEQKDKKKE